MDSALPLDQVLEGDCLTRLAALPDASIDLVFADPPYNLQLRQDLYRPNRTRVDGVDDAWDHFSGFADYDDFTRAWLTACRRVLKPTGTLWVIGTYHNIFRVGAVLQDLGYWILNSVVWVKANPMPNFRGVRFTNSHEILIWAQPQRGQRYTFHHRAMRALNDDLQMRADWTLPLCTGGERLRVDGAKAHPTQKPEALLYRVLMASSDPGDTVLDPFFGTGTTGAVARRLGRRFIGIEQDPDYARLARERIAAVLPADPASLVVPAPRREPRLPFGALLEHGLLHPGQSLYFGLTSDLCAHIMADGTLICNGQRGTIHALARSLRPGPANGWTLWHYEDPQTGQRFPIDRLRQMLRSLPSTAQEDPS
jgi:modification methylase